MYRQNFSNDPYNSFNSFSPYDSYDNYYNSSSRYDLNEYSFPSTTYNSSSHNYFSYREDGYPNHYEEAPSIQYQMASYNGRPVRKINRSKEDLALIRKLTEDLEKLTSDVNQLEESFKYEHQLVQYHRGNQYNNTNNYGWSCEPSFRREEGNNYGFPNYQWEPSSQYEMPPPHLTTPIQQESRSYEYQALLDELKKNISKIEKYNEEEQERLKNVHVNKSFETSNKLINAPLSQLEILAEKHEQDYVLEPALRFDEEEVEKDEPSPEEDSEDEGNTIIIDDITFVTSSSFSCDAGQQFNDEDHTMQDETETCPSNVLARDESSIPLSDLVAHFIYNDDSDYTGIIQWVVIREVIEHQDDLEDKNESTKESSKDKGDTNIIDDFVSVTPPSFSCVVAGNWCDKNQTTLATAEVPKEILVLKEKQEEEMLEEEKGEDIDPSEEGKLENSIAQDEIGMKDFNILECDEFHLPAPLPSSKCTCGSIKPCEDCKEINEWLEEEEEEKEFVDPPPSIIQQQLEIEKTPLYIDFVIPFYSTTTSLYIVNFISYCGVGVKEIIYEEQADQRVGSIFCSLQRRRLLPLWIFKENLKPD